MPEGEVVKFFLAPTLQGRALYWNASLYGSRDHCNICSREMPLGNSRVHLFCTWSNSADFFRFVSKTRVFLGWLRILTGSIWPNG